MKISRRSFSKIMASTFLSMLTGCVNIFANTSPAPEKNTRMISGSEVLRRISPWFRSYQNSRQKLAADDNHVLEFSHWLKNRILLAGQKGSFEYDQKNHYQLANRGPAVISDVYYVYETAKINVLLTNAQPYWPDGVKEVIKKIKSGEVKINRAVLHWHRHHDKLKDPAAFHLIEAYYMIVYVGSQDRVIPVLEITHNAISVYKRAPLSFDVERIFAKALSTDGLFRAPDSVVVNWQELPETIGVSRRNIFWVAADLEASHSQRIIHYFADVPEPVANMDLFLLYSPSHHVGRVLTEFMNVIASRGETGLTTFALETVSGSNHYNYFSGGRVLPGVEVGNSGIALPDEKGEAFKKFLEFLAVSIPGMVSYLGDGKFSVITKPQGALVVDRERKSSPMAGIGHVTIKLGEIIGGPGPALDTALESSITVDNHGDYKRKKYRESAENSAKIDALNQAGILCAKVADSGKTSGPLAEPRLSSCRECESSRGAYADFADVGPEGFLAGKLTAAALATKGATSFADYVENEAYIDALKNGTISGCFNLI